MASYSFFDQSTTPATEVGTLDATFDSVNNKLTDVSYTNNVNGSPTQSHGDIPLTGPDGSGNYTGNKQFNKGLDVTGHTAHKHISFTFNPTNPAPDGAFTNGVLDNMPGGDDGFDWSATSDSTVRGHKYGR